MHSKSSLSICFSLYFSEALKKKREKTIPASGKAPKRWNNPWGTDILTSGCQAWLKRSARTRKPLPGFPEEIRATWKSAAGEKNGNGTASHSGYITSLKLGFLVCQNLPCSQLSAFTVTAQKESDGLLRYVDSSSPPRPTSPGSPGPSPERTGEPTSQRSCNPLIVPCLGRSDVNIKCHPLKGLRIAVEMRIHQLISCGRT